MKLIDALSLMLSLGFIIIGVDQSIRFGFANSYWIFMLSLGLIFFYGYRKGQGKIADREVVDKKPKKKQQR